MAGGLDDVVGRAGEWAYRRALTAERAAKDAFFRTSLQSPLEPRDQASFTGLAYYPVDPAFQVPALPLLPYRGDGPATFDMPASDGQQRPAARVGSLVFTLGGVELALTAYRFQDRPEHGALFVPFIDETSGRETYGAGRYLDLEASPDGEYVLDFNLAYHPFCAYSPYFSCPLTPAENRLAVAVRAGERLRIPAP